MRLFPQESLYFQEDGFSLLHGNSLELLEQLSPESVDMVFADPPYNLSNGGFTCHGGQRVSVNKGEWDQSNGLQEDFTFHSHWLQACYRVLKPEGTLWLSGSYHSIFTCGYALLKTGFKILNDICWFKPNGSPNLSCRYFTASHETLIWAIKDPRSKHVFNYESMKFGDWHHKDVLKKESKQMRSVWSIGTARGEEKKQGKHPTQKPIALLHRIVLASTQKGDLILDPFSGSGTTGIAAHQHGRSYLGIELDKEYLDLSIKRLQAQKQQMEREKQEEKKEKQRLFPASTAKEKVTIPKPPRQKPKRIKRIKTRKKKAATSIVSEQEAANETNLPTT